MIAIGVIAEAVVISPVVACSRGNMIEALNMRGQK